MEEVWKEIEGYDGWYEVSNKGRVRSWKSTNGRGGKVKVPRILKNSRGSNAYLSVALCGGKISPKTFSVHSLVAGAFLSKTEEWVESWREMTVNHKDGNKLNNNLDNLEYCTNRENVIHGHVLRGLASSRYPGVSKFNKRWRALIQHRDKLHFLCYVLDEKTAAAAYREALQHVDKSPEEFIKVKQCIRPVIFGINCPDITHIHE